MRIAPLLAASVVAIGLSVAAGSSPSQAASLVPELSKSQSLAEPAGYRHRHWYWRHRGYCWRWRHICADRWGWGSWRYYRCLRRHGC